jgi:putative chitinase
MTIDKDTIQAIVPGAKTEYVQALVNAVVKDGVKYGIDTAQSLAMFIAQTAHETGGYVYMMESGWLKNPDAWSKANTKYYPYQGRGFIQLTHDYNYKDFSIHYFGDNRLLSNPRLMNNNPILGAYAALWFWKYGNGGGVAQLAREGKVLEVTKKINGGTKGLTERKIFFNKAIAVMKKKIYQVKWKGQSNYSLITLWNYLTHITLKK